MKKELRVSYKTEVMYLKQLLKLVLFVQFLMCVTIFLDIPIGRQIVGFIFLSFIPGIVCLKIIKVYKVNVVEFALLSVGTSIAFLMFIGVLINELYPLAGFSEPLSTPSLTITINIVLLGLLTISHFTDKFSISTHSCFNTRIIFLTLLLFLFPFLSVLGASLVNYIMNNSILLLLIMFIAVFVNLSVFSERWIPTKLYPIAIVAIAIALVFYESLTTSHLWGYNIHLEYYLSKVTSSNSFWKSVIAPAPLETSTYNAMLSITILPTIYSNLLNISGVYVFKILYPLIFSLVPLGLYQIYQKEMGKRTAFLATFFFMSFYCFYRSMLMDARQMIAELFFCLLIFLLVDKKIDSFKKRMLFIVFSMGLIVSHYSVSYLFLFLILFTYIFSLVMKYKIGITKKTITLFFTMVFSWYIYVSASAPFEDIVQIGHRVFSTIYLDFFNPLEMDPVMLKAIGIGPVVSIGHEIGRVLHNITQLFVIIGVITMLRKRKEGKYNVEYILMSFVSVFPLLMSLVLPYFSVSFGIERLYHLSLFLLAPSCILGGETFFRYVLSIFGKVFARVNIKVLVLIVLTLYFLINTGFVYEITGDVPYGYALSMHRMDTANEQANLYNVYTSGYEILGARWLARVRDPSTRIYSDVIAKSHVLTSYGMIPSEYGEILSNDIKKIEKGAYIYFRGVNIIHGKMAGWKHLCYIRFWNTSEISYLFNGTNKIYSNGGCDIYKK